jgi:hypothetical protein
MNKLKPQVSAQNIGLVKSLGRGCMLRFSSVLLFLMRFRNIRLLSKSQERLMKKKDWLIEKSLKLQIL